MVDAPSFSVQWYGHIGCQARGDEVATRGITVLAGGLKETREITRRAEAAGFDAAWSGEFLHRSAGYRMLVRLAGVKVRSH